jgi:hypothetical protein
MMQHPPSPGAQQPGHEPPAPSLPRRLRHLFAPLLILLASLAFIGDCTSNHGATGHLKASKPLIDFGRGAGGFALTGNALPVNRDELVRQLTVAYGKRVVLPTTHPAVVASGDHYPKLDSLAVDLSDARMRPGFKPTENKGSGPLTPAITVGRLSYVAHPLFYEQGRTNLTFSARDVQLSLLKSKADKSVLVVTDAHDGIVDFDIPMSDLHQVALQSARDNAGRAAFFVTDVDIHLDSDGPHSLSVALEVDGLWLLLPSSLQFTARVDIDDQFNVHLSHLSCDGGGLGGPLVAPIISSVIKKYEQKTIPLAAFPGNKIKLRALAIRIDDSLHLHFGFGA